MSKFKIISIMDTIFISFVIMLIIFAWVQFFVRNFLLSLIVSTALSIAIILLVRQLRLRKHNAINLKISQQTNFNIFKLILLTSPTLKIATIIKNMLPSQYNPKITKSDINFVKNDTTHTFTFCFINLDETKLLELIKTYTAKNLTIFCNSCDNSIYHLTKVFKNKTIVALSSSVHSVQSLSHVRLFATS